ncbi:hypothetical protein EO92_01005 [Methanosarcina sp. 2.H.A.1B.4]|nr:hypothetical protein EO92_01005 [Methanosarcina sp. 2.H.A.1B.4]
MFWLYAHYLTFFTFRMKTVRYLLLRLWLSDPIDIGPESVTGNWKNKMALKSSQTKAMTLL